MVSQKFSNISTEQNKNICTIVGIFLDNAIEAVSNLNNKYISILFYKENNKIVISISNTYEGIINLEKMNLEGYSKKGINREFG